MTQDLQNYKIFHQKVQDQKNRMRDHVLHHNDPDLQHGPTSQKYSNSNSAQTILSGDTETWTKSLMKIVRGHHKVKDRQE